MFSAGVGLDVKAGRWELPQGKRGPPSWASSRRDGLDSIQLALSRQGLSSCYGWWYPKPQGELELLRVKGLAGQRSSSELSEVVFVSVTRVVSDSPAGFVGWSPPGNFYFNEGVSGEKREVKRRVSFFAWPGGPGDGIPIDHRSLVRTVTV